MYGAIPDDRSGSPHESDRLPADFRAVRKQFAVFVKEGLE